MGVIKGFSQSVQAKADYEEIRKEVEIIQICLKADLIRVDHLLERMKEMNNERNHNED